MFDAVVRNGLSVAFQPIVELESGRTFGYEALGRVDRRIAAWDPPALLDEAWRRGRLLEVDRRLRELALREVACHDLRHGEAIFLNVDTRIFEDPAFVPGFTSTLLDELDIAGDRIILELCERHPELTSGALLALMRHYEAQGFRVALDDFGAGHATLDALVAIAPKLIKLDKSLVRGVAASAMRFQLCKALAGFARAVEVDVVAEGIEDGADLDALREAGVGLGQGFLLGVPRPLCEYERSSRRTRTQLRLTTASP